MSIKLVTYLSKYFALLLFVLREQEVVEETTDESLYLISSDLTIAVYDMACHAALTLIPPLLVFVCHY